MWFENDFKVNLERVYSIHVEGHNDEDDVTGYVYSTLTDIIIEDEDGNIVAEDDEHYPELMVIVHEREYNTDDWS